MNMSIKYIIPAAMAVILASCSEEELSNSPSEATKTPLEVSVRLDDSNTETRATDASFEVNDVLYAYVEQVARAGQAASYTYTTKIGDLVDFSVKTAGATVTTDNLGTVLYWDDFSSDDNDIRSDDRYLRVGYGFCFNGGTPTTGLTSDVNKANGKIQGWTISSTQSTISDFKKCDLLWAGVQNEIKYSHDPSSRPVLPVVYTHAMSKVTIEINLGEGFGNFSGDTYPTLYANTMVSEVDAIHQTITTASSSADTPSTNITKMYLKSSTDKKRVYEAIIAPTVMKADNKLCSVTVEGNTYNIILTNALLTTGYDGGTQWSSQLKGYTISGTSLTKDNTVDYSPVNGGITLPGVNYKMVVNLKKQKIEVQASITDWTPVTSQTEGKIQFSADVTDPNVTANLTSGSFDLWLSSSNTESGTTRPAAATYDSDGSTDGIQKASTYTRPGDEWEGSPVLYWPNGTQKYYFRALAKVEDPANNPNVIKTVEGSQAAAQGTDLLWAQTSAHTGTTADGGSVTYGAGDPINPRTGNVPLTFEHAMSKISVTLKNKYTSSDVPTGVDATNYNDPRNPLVNLDGAKISIINLYDKGTIDISNGKMVTTSLACSTTDPYTFSSVGDENKVNDEYKWLDKIVVPQSLEKDKEGANRDTNPSFYSLANLTAIYSNGKSIPVADETPTYYLTTALEKVEEKYTVEDANAYNLSLPAPAAVWTTSTVKEPARLYTYDEYKTVFTTTEYQTLLTEKYSEIPTKAKQVDYTFDEFKDLTFSAELFAAIPNDLKIKTPAGTYADFQEYNTAKGLDNSSADKTSLTEEQFAALSAEQKAKPAVLFQFEEIDAFKTALASKGTDFNSLSGDWKKKTLNLEEYKALNPVPEELFNLLPESLKTRSAVTYTVDEVNEHNATLPGAVHAGEIKRIYHKIKDDTTPESHKIGEVINRGNKIMLYVTLADGTIYSIDLATCKVDGSDVGISEWLGGYHYNYTITLSKEDIKFRALVKNWDDVQGSGNATLDWD